MDPHNGSPFAGTCTQCPILQSLHHTLLAVAFFFVVIFYANHAASDPLMGSVPWLRRWVVLLGKYSYTVYLAQVLAKFPQNITMSFLRRIIAEGSLLWWTTSTLLFIAGSIVLGYAASRLVELPALQLRERWLPARAKAL